MRLDFRRGPGILIQPFPFIIKDDSEMLVALSVDFHCLLGGGGRAAQNGRKFAVPELTLSIKLSTVSELQKAG